MPNGRCRMHGGKTPSGIASPHFIHGRRSTNLPARMLADYEATLRDPDLLNIHDDIAITRARREDLLARVDTGESGETWRSLRETYYEAQKALLKWNACDGTLDGVKAKDTFFQAYETIGALISEGAQDYQAWDEVNRMVEQRRKLSETEAKRLEKMGQMITADKIRDLVGAVVGVIKRHVTDRDTLAALSSDIIRIVSAANSRGA